PLPAKGAPASSALDLAKQLNQAFIEVADKVSDSVVVIRVAHDPNKAYEQFYRERFDEGQGDEENPFREFFRRQFEREKEKQKRRSDEGKPREPIWDGQGSGVIIREDGYIMTNRHVVDEAEKVKVKLKNGTEFDAVVRGVDAQSDIAVLKIDTKGARLPVAKLGDSSKVRVGEFAIAIGTPYDLDYSVTFGHVSAKGRSRIIPNPSMDQDFIQTDANINPGNSGGPLVNINGEVIGINTMIRGLNTGIGFAVPINLAHEVADALISDGKFTRAWLGVSILGLKEFPEFQGLAKGVKDGVVVREIVPDGPAAKSELKPGDVVTAVDGQAVSTSQQLKNEIRTKKVGASVTLDVVRAGKNIKVKVKPEAWPEELTQVTSRRLPAAPAETTDLGVTVKPLTKELADHYGVVMTPGLIVTDVIEDSPAAHSRLREGDVITEIDQKPVTNLKQFRDALKNADLKKGVIVNLVSRGVSKFEVLKNGE
ncbi:MAG: trypsin-like peptidase domain-containing protein, partial [Verrucomicrobiota bacterium]